MSRTNSNKTELNCSEVKPEDNMLRGKEPGSVTIAENPRKRDVEKGVESLTLVVIPYIINKDGERMDKQGNQLSKATRETAEIELNYNRMEKFNAEIEKESKKETKQTKKLSEDHVENR